MPSPLAELIKQTRSRLSNSTDVERLEIVEELRRTVDRYYDHGFGEAMSARGEERFANEVGLFSATSVILTGEEKPHRRFDVDLQLEHIPFNPLPSQDAKEGLKEYLIWKFFPENADTETLAKHLNTFRGVIFAKAEQIQDEVEKNKYIYDMFYDNKTDWQTFITDNLEDRKS